MFPKINLLGKILSTTFTNKIFRYSRKSVYIINVLIVLTQNDGERIFIIRNIITKLPQIVLLHHNTFMDPCTINK